MWRPIEWIGTRSFSLYLVHEPLLVSLGFLLRITRLSWWFVLLGLGACLAATEVFYRAVEVPSMRIGRWKLRRSPAFA